MLCARGVSLVDVRNSVIDVGLSVLSFHYLVGLKFTGVLEQFVKRGMFYVEECLQRASKIVKFRECCRLNKNEESVAACVELPYVLKTLYKLTGLYYTRVHY